MSQRRVTRPAMASALLQLKALPCSSVASRPITHSAPQSGRIQCSGSAFLPALGLARRGRCRAVGRRRRRRRGGVDPVFVGITKASEEDTTGSVAVEDVDEDVSEEPLSPEEEEDRQNVQDILMVVELLRTKRDMAFNEVRLTIMIEDPRDVERRKLLNIEDDRGCSREELGIALQEVYEGRIPQDRITLRELTKEMMNWPYLEEEIYPQERLPPVESPYAKVTDTGVDPRLAAQRAKVDWDSAAEIQPGEEKKDLSEVLPPAVGFSFLYLLSGLPIIIGITVVVILFLNSLQ